MGKKLINIAGLKINTLDGAASATVGLNVKKTRFSTSSENVLIRQLGDQVRIIRPITNIKDNDLSDSNSQDIHTPY